MSAVFVAEENLNISAQVIADSITPDGRRLTSVQATGNRFILAEVNTHCVLARNSASSRAIPLAKMLERVRTNPAFPVAWPAEQKGMQGGEETDRIRDASIPVWQHARDYAVADAERLGQIGLHKSVANRLLEPFMWHTMLITATAWDNFFRLRLDAAAQPEFRVMAEQIKAAIDASEPRLLREGEWHLPYITGDDIDAAQRYLIDRDLPANRQDVIPLLVKMSSAKCARTSYLTQQGVRDVAEDLRLYETLTSNGHSSPMEHVATPAPWNEHEVEVASMFPTYEQGSGGINVVSPLLVLTLPVYGKFLGWHQHRFDVEAERNYQAFA